MQEVDIDVSAESLKGVTDQVVRDAEIIMAMSDGEECPYCPEGRYDDWKPTESAGPPLEVVRVARVVRDDAKARANSMLGELAALAWE